MYKVFPLYAYTGGNAEHKVPKGFKVVPSLETYLNYLGDQGYNVISVLKDECWYRIVTTKED